MISRRVVVIARVAASIAGCSFTVRGPRAGLTATDYPVCDQRARVRRALDLTAGGTAGVAGVMLLAGSAICDGGVPVRRTGAQIYPGCLVEDHRTLLAVGLLSVATLYAAAIYVSGKRVRACRAAHRRHLQWKERGGATSGPGVTGARER